MRTKKKNKKPRGQGERQLPGQSAKRLEKRLAERKQMYLDYLYHLQELREPPNLALARHPENNFPITGD